MVNRNYNYNKFLIIISGATASGKTELSEKISQNIESEIINADIGQMYQPFCIGTAKPDWKKEKISHHLFDILNEPQDLSVVEYRKLVLDKTNEIWSKNKIPILVGGSLFYLKSLFYPPKKLKLLKSIKIDYSKDVSLWHILNEIDSKRAEKIHKNDLYRIKRALNIWEKYGIKPSKLIPEFNPFFSSIFIYIDLDKNILDKRINKRTKIMLKSGWMEEVQPFVNTIWEDFFLHKGLIGYKEIADCIKDNSSLKELENNIALQTRQYAKRQKKFWKNFKKQLLNENEKSKNLFLIKEVKALDPDSINKLFISLKKEIENFCCR